MIEETDEEMLSRLEGLYVGQLLPSELAAFGRCIARGTYYRDYSGNGGFLGMAKVRRVADQQSGAQHD